MINPNQVAEIELFDNAAEPVVSDSLFNKVGLNKDVLIEIGIYGGIGFIVGFLLKKYSEYFISFALLLVGLVVLQQYDYLTVSINAVKVQRVLGLGDLPLDGVAFGSLLLEWMKANIAGSSSLVVGFLIGLKVG